MKEDCWGSGIVCEEKKEYLEKRLIQNETLYISTEEKKTIERLENLDKWIPIMIRMIPTTVFIFLLLIEMKITEILKTNFFFCFVPIFFYMVLFWIQLLMHLYSKNKKWKDLFFWNEISLEFSLKGRIAVIFSFVFLTLFFVLLIVRLDLWFSLSWNFVMTSLHFCIFLTAVFIYFERQFEEISDFFYFLTLEISVLLFLSFSILFHLSIDNILPLKTKWIVTFIPFYVIDFIFSVISCSLLYGMCYNNVKSNLKNLTIVTFLLSFVLGNIFLVLFLIGRFSIFFNFSFFQSFLFFLQISLFYSFEPRNEVVLD